MALPVRDAMLEHIVDIVADHYRQSEVTLLLDGQPHNGIHRPDSEFDIVIDFKGPYKRKADGEV